MSTSEQRLCTAPCSALQVWQLSLSSITDMAAKGAVDKLKEQARAG